MWGYERSPNTQTPHIQGYLELQRSQRLQFVARILPRANWSVAERSVKDNFLYCIKGSNFEVIGDFRPDLGLVSGGGRATGTLGYGPIIQALADDGMGEQVGEI